MGIKIDLSSFMATQAFFCCYSKLNGQNDRVAIIEDDVQRGLGTFPQQANLRRITQREIRENE